MGKKPVAPVLGADGSLPLLTGTNQVIGGRKYQEDRSVCIADINPMALKHHPDLDVGGASFGTRRAFFAVFDGFGGGQSSEWLKLHFHTSLIRHKAFVSNPEQAVRETFASTDEELLRFMESQDLKRGTGPALVRSGSCGTVCLVVGNEVFIGNVGDSSAVVFRRKGAAGSSTEMLSTDHKASEPSERERIAAAGGTTEQKTQNVTGFLCWASKAVPVGPVRVQPGGLAVSRAFGAGHAKLEELNGKPGCVTCEPAVRREELDAHTLCLIIASDGVWDNVKKMGDLYGTVKEGITQARAQASK